jgi:hypothetical protein
LIAWFYFANVLTTNRQVRTSKRDVVFKLLCEQVRPLVGFVFASDQFPTTEFSLSGFCLLFLPLRNVKRKGRRHEDDEETQVGPCWKLCQKRMMKRSVLMPSQPWSNGLTSGDDVPEG